MEAVRSVPRRRSDEGLAPRVADAELISRIEGRDGEAFSQLVGRHGPAAHALARRILRHRGAAEDVTRESFLRVWQLNARYSPDRGSVGAWLLTIVHQRSVEMLRRENALRRPEAVDVDVLDRGPRTESLAARIDGPSDRPRVRAAITALPVFQRRVIEMMYLDACSPSEVAENLGLPLQTVKDACLLGMRDLRRMLAVAAVR